MTVGNSEKPVCFQEIIINLQKFWSDAGCVILQPYDMEVGAGTFHPATTLRSLGPDSWATAYVQNCRRPTDGRYGDNPNRLQQFFQFQVIIKPSPDNFQEIYLNSLSKIGIATEFHDIRFVEDDWESPTLGASGLGWEVWIDGMEISQFTYFQQMCGHECNPVSGEITYGLERLAMYILANDHVMDIPYNQPGLSNSLTYGDVFRKSEAEYSRWNFDICNIDVTWQHFIDAEIECLKILDCPATDPVTGKKIVMVHPAYDQCIKASHLFNLLDARGAISPTQRQELIGRVRKLARTCSNAYLDV